MPRVPVVRAEYERLAPIVESLREAVPEFGQWWHLRRMEAHRDQFGRAHPAREDPDTSRPIKVQVDAPDLHWMICEIVKLWGFLPRTLVAAQWEGLSADMLEDLEDELHLALARAGLRE